MMRSVVAVVRQREYFIQAIRRTPSVASSPTVDQTIFQASSFLTTLISSTKSPDDTCSGSDVEEEPNKCLSLRIEKLPKGVTVGSALQSWMGDGFPVHGGDVYHAINRLRKLGRNKRALELMEWIIRERPYRPGELEYSYLLEFTVKLQGISQGEKLSFSRNQRKKTADNPMHRTLSSLLLHTKHYHTSQSVKSTKKATNQERTPHKITRKPWEELPFLTELKETEEPEEALSLFHHYQQMGFRHDYPSYSSLIYKLAKSRNFDAIDQVLRLIRYRNVRCRESLFMALIQHYGKAGLVDKSVDVFHRMVSFDCVRTIQSLNTLINVLVDNSDLEKAQRFFHGAKNMSLRLNSVSFNILIKGFLDKCDWEAACKVFDEMLEMEVQPSVVTYNSLIGFLCRNNDLAKAQSLLEDMIQKRVAPNPVTFGLLMKGLCCNGEYNEAKKLMFDMEYRGCKPSLVNYGVLMSDLGKRGKIDEAKVLLNEMKKRRIKPDVVIYNILINHLCTEGRAPEAYRTLTEMQMKGCKPNAATYRMMVDGFCHIGDFESGLNVLNAMLASRHSPTPETFVCMVAGLITGGNLDHACFVLEVMGKKSLSFGTVAWQNLVSDLSIEDGGACSEALSEVISS